MSVDLFFLFGFFCCFLIGILLMLSLIVQGRTKEYEKLSTYECGFISFADARSVFSVSFYVVAILFLIFDVEIVLFIPIVLLAASSSSVSFIFLFILLFLLFMGFALEWKKIATFKV